VHQFIVTSRANRANGSLIHWATTRRIKVEAPHTITIAADRPVDWDRIGVVFVTFGIACSGIATLLYSVGFLIQALHHV
jgi:hypothetical protein